MSEQEFSAFMMELATVMQENRTEPTDRVMYLAMREWLHGKLVPLRGVQ